MSVTKRNPSAKSREAKPKPRTRRAKASSAWGFTGLLGFAITLVLGALGSGAVRLDWQEGRPTISVDREQLAALGVSLRERVENTGTASLPANEAEPAEQSAVPSAPQSPHDSTETAAVTPAEIRNAESIRIASFNIQVFGTSKLQKPDVMRALTSVVRNFDVVAIQEVRSTDDRVVPTFVDLINAEGARYSYVIGPRLGRTNSKEQYAILFDTSSIEVDSSSAYTTPDPQDRLHREPMAARFRVRSVPPDRAFTFTLVDIHTDPDETKSELDALADTFVGVQNDGSGEDDVILLGDLNVDEYHLGRLGQLPGITHAISGVTTNTRRSHMYDNMVFNRFATTEYRGNSGVLDLMTHFGLTQAAALEISDHCPIWAEFSVYESGQAHPVAGIPVPKR
jgi:endonuclease/exonuclease/phosphatase family metal-dependent hydrolase